MIKVLVNRDYGGFSLPKKFFETLKKELPEVFEKYVESWEDVDTKTMLYHYNSASYSARTDKDVIALFEKMYPNGEGARTDYGSVRVQTVDDAKYPLWWIHEYDGAEEICLEPPVNHGFMEL